MKKKNCGKKTYDANKKSERIENKKQRDRPIQRAKPKEAKQKD